MEKKKHIRLLVLAPHYPPPVVGGLEKQAHLLNRTILPQLASIQVLSNSHSGEAQPSVGKVEGVAVKRTSWMAGTRWGLVWDLLFCLAHVIRHRKAYDVVHVHNLSTYACVAAAVCHILRLPALIKLPNFGRMGIPGLKLGFFGRLRIACLRKAGGFVAMSQTSICELQAIGVPESKIFKMVNGIDLEAFDQAANQPLAVDLSPSGTDRTVRFVFTGRLMRQKGLLELVEAWARFQQGAFTQKAELWIVGQGPEEAAVREAIACTGLEDSVHLLGYREDIPALLRQCDVFVLPSHSEGNSNAILEAMAAGLPVISTDAGGSAMLLGDEGREFVIKPGDIDGLTHCLKRLGNDQQRTLLGKAMRSRVETHFDIQNVCAAYLECYDKLKNDQAGADLSNIGSRLFK